MAFVSDCLQLSNNVVFVLGGQQSDSVIHLNIYSLSDSFPFYKILSIVPCAIQ